MDTWPWVSIWLAGDCHMIKVRDDWSASNGGLGLNYKTAHVMAGGYVIVFEVCVANLYVIGQHGFH